MQGVLIILAMFLFVLLMLCDNQLVFIIGMILLCAFLLVVLVVPEKVEAEERKRIEDEQERMYRKTREEFDKKMSGGMINEQNKTH